MNEEGDGNCCRRLLRFGFVTAKKVTTIVTFFFGFVAMKKVTVGN